ncbi:hypothetical protein KNJ79_17595 [Sphingopyxis indica]|uniref:DUF4424 domain-containing protein n=2 Tax=Sphingopyxis indica TaxID=436663 RepID=A0A239HNU2_9SPHN|nr:hypothetical protein KNJ79_17595 [Sphingopyxis indica]SNS82972.1 hypothetical protein SAMN06295955_10641 [Sphingopyxis indica]
MRFPLAAAALGLSLLSIGIPPVFAMQDDDAAATGAQSPYSYSDLADLAVAAPIVIRAQIKDSAGVESERAPGLAAGHSRFYVEADIVSLIRGSAPLAKRISYLVDLPLDARGKPAKLRKKQPVLIFAQPVAAGGSGSASTSSIRLVAPDAQLAWDAATEAQLRAILTELVKPGAPPRITGIANGFHVPGTLPGEGETQLFLDTANGDPVSLTITTRADGSRRWSAAFGEIVEGAGIPKRNTLAWYRLACGLPRTLPLSKLAGTPAADRQKAASDYAAVLGALGECGRTRTPPPGA